MFYRRTILKRLSAGLGLALALLPCFQQSHAICRLAGCTIQIVTAMGDAHAVPKGHCGNCCGGNEATRSDRPAPVPCDNRPCGPECWCCQPPDPCEAPRNSTESAKLHLVADCACVTVSRMATYHADGLGMSSFAPDCMPAISSAEMCARLCRFLT
jgi:hypothetical protein